MQICASCHAPVDEDPDPPPSLIVFTCCSEVLCSRCIAPSITAAVEMYLWTNLGQETWVKCPINSCDGYLAFGTADQLLSLYIDVGATRDTLVHVEKFARAVDLRDKLKHVTPRLGRVEAETTKTLHERLEAVGVMAGVFNDMRSTDEIEVDSVYVLPLKGPTRMVRVPIVTSLFRRKAGSRNCTVCAEDLREVDIPDRNLWEHAVEKYYRTDVTRFLDPFPTADELPSCAAAHVLDVCKKCISRYISTKLEDQGVAGVLDLQCPSYGCGLIYTAQDIQSVTDQATFEKYERLCLIKMLSDEATFRWCLNPGCGSGAFYDTGPRCCDPEASTNYAVSAEVLRSLPPEARVPDRIVCRVCNFAMCFAHGTPWHRGLSCPEYTALEARGDSTSNASWIARNTKKCPGADCGVAVEKGNGCFHMTCGKCRFEFCWECLAPWADIFPADGYRSRSHREGCFFRSEEAPRPMLVAGETVGDAVEALEAHAVRMRALGVERGRR